MFFPKSIYGISFLVVVILELVIILTLEGYVFGEFEAIIQGDRSNGSQLRAIPTYLALFIFALLVQVALAWDALRLKNTIQVIGLVFYNLAMLVYAAIQIEQIREAMDAMMSLDQAKSDIFPTLKPMLITIPCIIALAIFLMAFLAFKLYREFGWNIYKHVGADLRMKRRYLTYQVFITLLKFDFLFFLGFTVQFIVIVLNTRDSEFGLTIAVIPITILLLLMVAWSVRRENLPGMVLSIIFFVGGLAYFLFKLVRMYQPEQVDLYVYGRRSLTAFAVITVVLIVITMVNAILCASNFNKGLIQHIAPRQQIQDVHKFDMYEADKHPTPVTRMIID